MTIPRLLAPTVLAALVLAPAAPANDVAPDGEALITKVYDFTGVGPDLRSGGRSLDLLPFTSEGIESEDDENGDGQARDMAYELLVDHLAPDELSYEGRSIEGRDDALLLVTAPAAVQAQAQRLLDFMRRAFGRRATLVVTVDRVLDPALLDAPPETAEALERLEASGALVRLARTTERLPLGRPRAVTALTSRRLVRRWDVDIAQNAAVSQPRPDTLQTGLDLRLHLADLPGSDAYELRYAARLSELAGLVTESVPQRTTLTLDTSTTTLNDQVDVELSTVAVASVAGSGALSAGDSLQALAFTRTASGRAGYLLGLSLEAVDPAPAAERFGEELLAVVDLSGLAWPALGTPDPARLLRTGQPNLRDAPELFSRIEAEGTRLAFPAEDWDGDSPAWNALVEPTWERGGAWTLGTWAAVLEAPETLQQSLARLPATVPTRRPLVLDLFLGPGGDAPIARLRLELPTSGVALGLVGDVRTWHAGQEILVATSASSTQPEFADALDGLAVRARADDRGTVHLELGTHRMTALERVETRAPGSEHLDRPVFAEGSVQADVPADGERHEVGDLPSFPADVPALTLWARVTAR